jgi:hypothetical protein
MTPLSASPALFAPFTARPCARLRRFVRIAASLATLFAVSVEGPMYPANAAMADPSPAALPAVIQSHGDSLAKVSSDADAHSLFVSAIGPALGMQDVAATVNAKAIPAKMAKDLLVPEITESARRLVAALAIWQWAETASPEQLPPPARIEWFQATGVVPSLSQAVQQLAPSARTGPDQTDQARATAEREFLRTTHRLAMEASQAAAVEWWQLKTWKDRVRALRGRNRLCGTWQWVIHNHQQHHQEQKLSLIFPPPDPDRPLASGLVETVVLGENVYLRWEINGQIQEDSLQFSKEGQRLEGTFVNSQGGWGSITGKRTADCRP